MMVETEGALDMHPPTIETGVLLLHRMPTRGVSLGPSLHRMHKGERLGESHGMLADSLIHSSRVATPTQLPLVLV